MKKPWYIWLSVLTCIYLFSVLSAKASTKKPFDIDVWLSFCVHAAEAWIVYIMLPASVLLAFKLHTDSTLVADILNIFIGIVLYFGGVYAAGRMYQWGHARQFLK